MLKEHYNPRPSEIVQRFKFNTRFWQPEESISTYVSQLRSLAEFYNFGAALDDMLRDSLVCGINDSQIQHRLLSMFGNALSLALGQETAAKNVRALQGALIETTGDAAVHKVDFKPQISIPQQPAHTYTSGKGPCY